MEPDNCLECHESFKAVSEHTKVRNFAVAGGAIYTCSQVISVTRESDVTPVPREAVPAVVFIATCRRMRVLYRFCITHAYIDLLGRRARVFLLKPCLRSR